MTSFKIYSDELSQRAQQIIRQITEESARLQGIFAQSSTYEDFRAHIERWAKEILNAHTPALDYYHRRVSGQEALNRLRWKDYAAIRVLDYLEHSGNEYNDPNQKGRKVVNAAFRMLWQAVKHGSSEAGEDFFEDMLHLFRQLSGRNPGKRPDKEQVLKWMERHPSGLDPDLVIIREKNKIRILDILIDEIDSGRMHSHSFVFEEGMQREEKMLRMMEWWNDYRFHLRFAIRSPELLNRMLNNTLSKEQMQILQKGKEAGIPTYVNPYYLSLLNIKEIPGAEGCDQAIRDYILVSRELMDEFGNIIAWEKEDVVEPGVPNAAGWMLPTKNNLHRRYPEVAILIPETLGRACGGLCVSCQRMYDFQSGHLSFNLDRLEPTERWPEKLRKLMEYFEKDSQLRDVLITGGDALMSTDKSLRRILDAVYDMALRKKEANLLRDEGHKFAEMMRVRLGTRLPVYLPQRIRPSLISVLKDFKEKAQLIGIRQFVIQTHFESAIELSPEVKQAIELLISAGWTVINQQVFIASASKRGHTARLREALNDLGVLTYYTFTVKGYMENFQAFTPNARIAQEQREEKSIGKVLPEYVADIMDFPLRAEQMKENIKDLRKRADLPFLATDRSVINLPGVGKSLNYRVIGITRHGRRILQFDYDHTRKHSPIINEMGKIIIIESKTIAQYLRQMQDLGEDATEYLDVYGYSIAETETRMPIYKYPEYDFDNTERITNLQL